MRKRFDRDLQRALQTQTAVMQAPPGALKKRLDVLRKVLRENTEPPAGDALFVKNGVSSRTWFQLRGDVTIGSSADADVRVEADYVSRLHCVLRKVAADWLIEDSGSTYGVFVNGDKVE